MIANDHRYCHRIGTTYPCVVSIVLLSAPSRSLPYRFFNFSLVRSWFGAVAGDSLVRSCFGALAGDSLFRSWFGALAYDSLVRSWFGALAVDSLVRSWF